MTDWRLQGQDKFLQGVTLIKKTYRPYREKGDHDHCEFCGTQFSELPEDLHVGYVTSDSYHWICEPCFNDFREMFQWSVVADAIL